MSLTYRDRQNALARLRETDTDYRNIDVQVANISLMESTVNDKKALDSFKSQRELEQRRIASYSRLKESTVIRAFNRFIGNAFVDSLEIDDRIKAKHRPFLEAAVVDEFNKLTGKETPQLQDIRKVVAENYLLTDAINQLVESTETLIEAKAKEIPVEDIEFSPEELPEVEGNTSDEISKAVNDKVIEVLKAEEESAEQKAADMEELIAQSKPVTEGTQNLFAKSPMRRPVQEDYTLFRAHAIASAKEAIKENVEGFVVDGKVQMDMVITEATIRYTLMEFFNTLYLKTYTPFQITEMANRIARA